VILQARTGVEEQVLPARDALEQRG